MMVALVCAAPASAALQTAVEFYNAALDHYFVTANADEIGKLDSGFFVGWKRTQLSFNVADAATATPAQSPVCRFYGLPAAGLDSHFYSASPAECDAVRDRFPGVWQFESANVFKVGLPDPVTGACAAGSIPIYRSWNNRADSNHRYTTSASVQQQMLGKGYIAEGYGPTPVAMCSPTIDPAARPSCSLTASNGSPTINSTITLMASCTGSPASYQWTGCTSSTSSCDATSASPGTITYGVVAVNAGGASVPASLSIAWQAPPPPEAAPVCALSITSQNSPPAVGQLVTLFAYCTGNPTGVQWTGCVSSTTVCQLRGQAATGQTVSVSASNGGGTGNTASIFINWTSTTSAPVGLCGQYPSALYTEVGTASTVAYSTYFADSTPGFAYNGVWAVHFTVPPTAGPGQFGSLAAAEFGGPPTFREVTISYTACDFRPTDPTGANGPIGRSQGNSATLPFVVGSGTPGYPALAAGQAYYFNVRNFIAGTGVSCMASQVHCNALVNVGLPR